MFRKLKSSNISKKICILIMILLLSSLMCIVYIKLNNIYKNNAYKKKVINHQNIDNLIIVINNTYMTILKIWQIV